MLPYLYTKIHILYGKRHKDPLLICKFLALTSINWGSMTIFQFVYSVDATIKSERIINVWTSYYIWPFILNGNMFEGVGSEIKCDDRSGHWDYEGICLIQLTVMYCDVQITRNAFVVFRSIIFLCFEDIIFEVWLMSLFL